MVKILTGPELLSLYNRNKLIHHLVRWNPEYVKCRKSKWLQGYPPHEPLELVKVYTMTHQNNKIVYVVRMLCSDKQCGCRSGNARHPWVLNEDGSAKSDISNSNPVLAKYGAFIINP